MSKITASDKLLVDLLRNDQLSLSDAWKIIRHHLADERASAATDKKIADLARSYCRLKSIAGSKGARRIDFVRAMDAISKLHAAVDAEQPNTEQ